jgi:hypothetical protein
MRAQSISEPPSNDRRSVEPKLYMLLKCQNAAVRRKLRDRNPDLFSAFEILDHTGIRLTLVIVVINLTLRLRDGSIVQSSALTLPNASQVLIALEQSYKLLRSSVSEYARDPAKTLLVRLLISQHHFPSRASLYVTPERILPTALFHGTYQEHLHSVSYSSVPQPALGSKVSETRATESSVLSP